MRQHSELREPFVSAWFLIASPIWITLGLIGLTFGSSNVDATGLIDRVQMRGILGPWITEWSEHLLFFATTLFPVLAALYVFVPLQTRRPLQPYQLLRRQFWWLIWLVPWAAAAELYLKGAPEWLTHAGLWASVLILFPVAATWIVLWPITAAGNSPSKANSTSGPTTWVRVVLVLGGLWFVGRTVANLGPVDETLGFTAVHSSLRHAALLIAAAVAAAMGINHRRTHSQSSHPKSRNARGIQWIFTVAAIVFVASPLLVGMREGWALSALDEFGNLRVPEFREVLSARQVSSAMMVVTGFIVTVTVLAWIGFAADRTRPLLTPAGSIPPNENGVNPTAVRFTAAESAAQNGTTEQTNGPSRGEVAMPANAPVLQIARRIDRKRCDPVSRLTPVRPANLLIYPLVAAILPLMIGSLSIVRRDLGGLSATDAATPTTTMNFQGHGEDSLIERGRRIYIREGCVACHSQSVRPLLADARRYGDPRVATDRGLMGNRRIGPDLALEGGKRDSLWHWRHFVDPRSIHPESPMPSMRHLASRRRSASSSPGNPPSTALSDDGDRNPEPPEVITEALRAAADVVSAGGPISTRRILTEESELIALIAYIQSLGQPRTTTDGGT